MIGVAESPGRARQPPGQSYGRRQGPPRLRDRHRRPVAAAGAAPMMGRPGAGFAGRPADGYPITDPRLADDGTAWSGDGTLEWSGEADPPPSILGHED
ncbi:hypothetical protein [Plantactinospora sp. BC1]|uniref:hypothetical protein n=1 Tax=Plantactinospora sp. BC1 TaxID=2108470 RepID=UPI00131F37CF|nr:hypothetical protein [Plantactinospora sp. BC1]